MKSIPLFQKYRYLPYILIAGVAILLYGRTATFEFTNLDDQTIILDNYGIIGDISNIPIAFTSDAFLQVKGGMFYRPLQTASFMFDASIGGKSPWIYHTTNVLLHVITCCLLCYLLTLLGFSMPMSVFFSLVYSVHPLFTHAVAWIPSRGDLLIALFGILSFAMFKKYIESPRWPYAVIHGISLAAAMLSKETAVLLPLVCAIYFLTVKKENRNWRRFFYLAVFWAACIALYWTARTVVLTGTSTQQEFGVIPFINNLPILLLLIGKFIVPLKLSTMPMIDPVSVGIGVATIVLLVVLVFTTPRIRRSMILFGAAWYLLLLGPTLLYHHPLADVAYQFFEHRAYLPCIGMVIVLSELLTVRRGLLQRKRAFRTAVIVTVLLAVLSMIHSQDYSNPSAFFQSAIDDNPRNAMAYNNLGFVKFYQGNLNGAMADFSKAVSIRPNYAQAYYNRALVYGQIQSYDAAIADYDRSIRYDSTRPMVYFNRAIIKWLLHDYAGSRHDCEKSMILMPGFWLWYYHRGNIESDVGRYDGALRDYDTAISCFSHAEGYNNPKYNTVINNTTNYADIYSNRAKTHRLLRRYQDALDDCEKALIYNPNNVEAYYNRGLVKSDLNDSAGAMTDFNMAIVVNQNYGPAYCSRGLLKTRIHDLSGACNDFRKSSDLGYKDADSLIKRYCTK